MEKVEEAQKLFESNRYDEALELYKQMMTQAPDDVDVLQGIAKCLFRLNRFDEVIEVSLKILKINNNLPEIHIILADAYDAINQIEKSRNEANIAYLLDPDSAEVLGCYGTYLIKDNNLDDGIVFLEKAEKLNNNLNFIHRNLATAYHKKNDKQKMIIELKRLYKQCPTFHLGFEIVIAYMNLIKFVNIIAAVIFIAILGAFVFRIWNLLWIAAFCIIILLILGLLIRKLWAS